MRDPLHLPLFSVLALATGLFAISVAALLVVFLPVQRWRQHRLFVLIALSAGLFAASDALATAPVPAWAVLFRSRLQLLCAGLHVYGWVAYAGADLGPLPRPWQRTLEALPVAIAALLALVPGLALTGTIWELPQPVLGVPYRIAQVSPVGHLGLWLIMGPFGVVAFRYAAATLRAVPQALPHFAALAIFVSCSVVDLFTVAGVSRLPFTLPFGIAAAVLPITLVLALRWRQDVEGHEALAFDLERQIGERTRALTQAQAALGRTEKLAAVGRLAGAMAHEINNPGAALIANLEYLELGLRRDGALPADVKETVSESLQASRRIARSVRQLLLLSRAAIAESEGQSFDLKSVASAAVRAARQTEASANLPSTLQFEESVPAELRARGRGQLLEQALRELLEHLALAAPAGRTCRISLTASAAAGKARLEVRTDFAALDPQLRDQLAEPFLHAPAPGTAASLGLATSLGLLRTLGVDVSLADAGGGTLATLSLDLGAPEAAPSAQ